MSRLLVNPITAAFDLLDRYRRLVGDNLALAGLAEVDVMAVLASLQVDHGLYFTLNRAYRSGKTQFRQFCADKKLAPGLPDRFPGLKQLHAHQEAAVLAIRAGETTIISTGTGSGKTEAFLVPLLDYCLQHPGPGLKALIVYPMNALANDQVRRLESAAAVSPQIGVGLYVGATSRHQREILQADPPDILVTNHIMLDRLLTRLDTRRMLSSASTLRYVVLDEIHTYRGNRATHLSLLLARLKDLIGHAPVYIGTSATLQSPQVPGYFVNDTDRRDNFIKPMLGVCQYTLIEPEYAPEPSNTVEPDAPIPWPNVEVLHLDWSLKLDPQIGLDNIGRLTGQAYSDFDLYGRRFAESVVYQAVAQHPCVQAIRRSLQGRACSLQDIAQDLARHLEPGYPERTPEALTRAWLSAIAFVNEMARADGSDLGAGDPPVLDFRLHLFLSDLGGFLRRCLKCQRYVSGRREYCPDCGYPTFAVYRQDIRLCVGKMNNGQLSWELAPASDDRPDAYYVLIATDDDSKPVQLH